MKKIFAPSNLTGAPLSGAIECNGLVFVSGQIHLLNGKLSGATIEEKFDLTINNVKKILEQVELSLTDVIKVNIYLTDINDLPAINQIYSNYFQHPLPVRTAVAVAALPLQANLEIEVIASK